MQQSLNSLRVYLFESLQKALKGDLFMASSSNSWFPSSLFDLSSPLESIVYTSAHISALSEKDKLDFLDRMCCFFSENAFFEKSIPLPNELPKKAFVKAIRNLWHALPDTPKFRQLFATVFKVTNIFCTVQGKESVYIIETSAGNTELNGSMVKLRGWIPFFYVDESKVEHYLDSESKILKLPNCSPGLLLAIHRLYMKSLGESIHVQEQDVALLEAFAAQYGSETLRGELLRIRLKVTPNVAVGMEYQQQNCYSKWFDPQNPEESIKRFTERCTFLSLESQSEFFQDVQRYFSHAAFFHHSTDFSADFVKRFKNIDLPFLLNSGLFANDKSKALFIQNVQQVVGICHSYLADTYHYYPVETYARSESGRTCTAVHAQLTAHEVRKSNLKVIDQRVRIEQSEVANAFLLSPLDETLRYRNVEQLVEMLVFALDSGVPTWIDKANQAVKSAPFSSVQLDNQLAKYIEREDVCSCIGRSINPNINDLNKEQLYGLFSHNCKQLSKSGRNFRQALRAQMEKIKTAPAFWSTLKLYRENAPSSHRLVIQEYILEQLVTCFPKPEYAMATFREAIGGLSNEHKNPQDHLALYLSFQKPEIVEKFKNYAFDEERKLLERKVGDCYRSRENIFKEKLWNDIKEAKLINNALSSTSLLKPKKYFYEMLSGSSVWWDFGEGKSAKEELIPYYRYLHSERAVSLAKEINCFDLLHRHRECMKTFGGLDEIEKIDPIYREYLQQGGSRHVWSPFGKFLIRLTKELAKQSTQVSSSSATSTSSAIADVTSNASIHDLAVGIIGFADIARFADFLKQEKVAQLFENAQLRFVYDNLLAYSCKCKSLLRDVSNFFDGHLEKDHGNKSYYCGLELDVDLFIKSNLIELFFTGKVVSEKLRMKDWGTVFPLFRLLEQRSNDTIVEGITASVFRRKLLEKIIPKVCAHDFSSFYNLLKEMSKMHPNQEKAVRYLSSVLLDLGANGNGSKIARARDKNKITEVDDPAISEVIMDRRLDPYYSTDQLKQARDFLRAQYSQSVLGSWFKW